jgi:hypothetical protein
MCSLQLSREYEYMCVDDFFGLLVQLVLNVLDRQKGREKRVGKAWDQ